MGYVSTYHGQSNEWNTEGGPNDTDLASIKIEKSSTSTRLDLFAVEETTRWDVVAYGNFSFPANALSVAELTHANVTRLVAIEDGNLLQELTFEPGFDFMQWLSSYDYRYSLLNGNDYFTGSLDNPVYGDQVRAGSGNDHFTGNNDGIDANGSVNCDSFFGEAGIDTAHFRGIVSEYRIVQDAAIWDARFNTQSTGIEVQDYVAGRDGTDWLKEVERLTFSDKAIAFDADVWDNAGSAYRLYKAAFDRAPDEVGLGYWIDKLDDGGSLQLAASGFLLSDEFKSLYGANPSDTLFLTKLYNNVLDRDPDQGGLDYWISKLNGGMSRESALINFSESDENVSNVADLIANGIYYQPWLG